MWALQFTCIKLVQDQVGPMFTVWGPMTLAMFALYPWVRMERGQETLQPQGKRPNLLGTYLLLAAVGAVAGLVPARRAAAVNPIVALRYE